jgi:hypothetical protein
VTELGNELIFFLFGFWHCTHALSEKASSKDIFFTKLIKTGFTIGNAKIIPQSYSINSTLSLFFDEMKIYLEEIPNKEKAGKFTGNWRY